MNKLKRVLSILFMCLILVAPAYADETGVEGVYCEDYNDPDTCYSDASLDFEVEQFLQSDDEATEEGLNEQTQKIKIEAGKLNPLNITGPSDILGVAIAALFAFIGSIALILYIYAGFIWMAAGGNQDRVNRAKSILIWTTLGIIAMGASYMIVNLVLQKAG